MTQTRLGAQAGPRDPFRRFPVIDGHNDLAWALREAGATGSATDLAAPVPFTHTDLPRLGAGGGGGQVWSAYLAAALRGGPAGGGTIRPTRARRRRRPVLVGVRAGRAAGRIGGGCHYRADRPRARAHPALPGRS